MAPLVGRDQELGVLLLITARPTFMAPFASHPVVTRVTRGKRLPEGLLEEIAARTDGVPLLVEEMTKAVIGSGVLCESAEAYRLDGPLSPLAIPTTLHDPLMARLDRLHPLKEVAQTAAVIGRAFDHRTIAALAGLPEAELADTMNKLVAADLVFRRGTPPDATYPFKHALVRDAAYESLLKSRRAALHARLLDILEHNGDAAPEVKARHAEEAGLAERALGYWEQAGVQALARSAFREAATGFGNAIRPCVALIDASARIRREQRLQLQLGQALIANLGYQAPAGLRAFERALALAEEIGKLSLQLPAIYGQWASRYVAGADTRDASRRYSELAESLSDPGPRLVGLRMLALEHFHQGRFTESLALLRKAMADYDSVAHRLGQDPRASAASCMSWTQWLLGFPDETARAIDDSLRFVGSIDHVNSKFFARYRDSITYACLRRPDRIEATACELMRVAADMAPPSGIRCSRSISDGRCPSKAVRPASPRSRPACTKGRGWALTCAPSFIASVPRSGGTPASARPRRPIFAGRWRSHGGRRRCRCSCAQRVISPGGSPSAASGARPGACWRRSAMHSRRGSGPRNLIEAKALLAQLR